MYSFPNLEPVRCSMSCSNCCFLICIQVSQEAGKVVWYSHLFKNFPQFFFVIHTINGFSIVNEAEVDVFLGFSCFFYDSVGVGNLISGFSAISKSSSNIWKFSVHILLLIRLHISLINLLIGTRFLERQCSCIFLSCTQNWGPRGQQCLRWISVSCLTSSRVSIWGQYSTFVYDLNQMKTFWPQCLARKQTFTLQGNIHWNHQTTESWIEHLQSG